MRLGDGVEDAIHSATMLAGLEAGHTMPASALADYHGLSPSYLVKHLKALVKVGILESVPGPLGGYRLARPASHVSLLDIVLAVEGGEPAFRCREIRQRGPGKLEPAAYRRLCPINAAMLKAERAYRASLAETHLSDILADFDKDADPRTVAFACAYSARHQRAQS